MSMRQVTKQEEHDVLLKISEMIAELGPDSYVATAFEGCIELAQQNIAHDELISMQQRWQRALCDCNKLKLDIEAAYAQNDTLCALVDKLQKHLEVEQEWKPYAEKDSVSDEDYEKLKLACTQSMTNAEAKAYVSEVCGFARDRVEICRDKFTYERNRHNTLRVSGTKERRPYYYASDWNYILFKCGGYTWELFNDELCHVD